MFSGQIRTKSSWGSGPGCTAGLLHEDPGKVSSSLRFLQSCWLTMTAVEENGSMRAKELLHGSCFQTRTMLLDVNSSPFAPSLFKTIKIWVCKSMQIICIFANMKICSSVHISSLFVFIYSMFIVYVYLSVYIYISPGLRPSSHRVLAPGPIRFAVFCQL